MYRDNYINMDSITKNMVIVFIIYYNKEYSNMYLLLEIDKYKIFKTIKIKLI